MQEKLKEKVISLTDNILNEIEVVDKKESESFPNKSKKIINQKGIIFHADSYYNFLKLKDELFLDSEIYINYTTKEIDNELTTYLILQDKSPEDFFKEILKVPKDNIEYYIPVYGAILSKTVEYGDIQFIKGEKFEKEITDKYKMKLNDIDKVYAMVSIKSASEKKGYELAKKKVDRLLYIFNFFINPLTDRIIVSTNNNISSVRNSIIINNGKMKRNLMRFGQIHPVDLAMYSSFESSTYKILINLYQKERKKNNIENRIIQSISWLGESYLQKENRYKFVQVITAIESLIQIDGNNIVNNMAEITAFILEDDYQGRIKMFERFKELYNVRSKIIHGEDTNIQYTDLKDAYKIVNTLVTWLLDNNEYITNIDELNKYVQKLKLS